MRIVYGLGNPGESYRNNRHNAGARLVRTFASLHNVRFNGTLDHAVFASASAPSGDGTNEEIILSLPTTYINASGKGFNDLRKKFSSSPEKVLVVFDDMDLETGALRLRPSGGSGGHRGMKSILNTAGTDEIPRMRIGIGRPPAGMDASDYVLQDFTKEELETIQQTLKMGTDAVKTWIRNGIVEAMNRYNDS